LVSLIVLAAAFIAGALLFVALRKDAEQYLNMNIEKNLFVPVFLVALVIIGVYIAQYVHLTESAGRASNAQQSVYVYGCIIENQQDCSSLINNMNNNEYSKLQSGSIKQGIFYIPFSLQESIKTNALTYFCLGALLSWISIFIYRLVKK